jgi:hypothetical protein
MPEVMEAAVEPVESSTEVIETGTETVETPESGAETVAEVDSAEQKQELTQKTTGRSYQKLGEVVKKSGEALKAIDPTLPAAIRTAAFELGGFYREFPRGLKEAVELKNTLSEYGGPEGLKEVAEANSDYMRLEQQYEKGDPAFIIGLADALPSSFSQIMPAGLEKWKTTDPEMYNHVQARVMMQTLDSIKVSDTLASIWNRLDPEKQKGERDAIEAIWSTIDGYRKVAEKVPERKTNPQEQALTQREQELAQREMKALLSPIANEGRQQIQSITDREMNQSYQWDKTDPSVKEAVQDRVRTEVINTSKKDKLFTKEFDRLKERGDSQGLSRHVKNFQDRVTPSIAQRVAKLFAVKPKGAVTQVKKPVVTNGTIQSGWEKVSQQPKFSELDRAAMGRNYEDMILDHKGILKGGRKIIWP